ncbi:Cilia- and flagella-associated protein 251, partial [Kappamyces sp. JEL0680]
ASKVAVVKIALSPDGEHCTTVDCENVVSLFHKQTIKLKTPAPLAEEKRPETPVQGAQSTSEESDIKRVRARVEWVFVARCKTHFKPVISLLYSTLGNQNLLYSISQDKHVVTYDLSRSNATDGVSVKAIRRIEQIHQPEAAILHQKTSNSQSEEFLMVFNSGLKCKLYAAETQLCRKTVLGPTFAGTINGIHAVPWAGEAKYFAFTSGNMIGLGKFPLDGNPYRYAGIIGHASDIANVSITHNGAYLLSSGGADGIVNMWVMNTAVVDMQIGYGGEGMEPFYQMLDPEKGKDGDIYREFEDYFFLGQIRTQGEDVSVDRIVGDTVRLDQVPSIMQGMGYYPSNQEIDDMLNEVKYGKLADGETNPAVDINFDDLIKLYLNYRPVFPPTKEDLEIALSHAKRLEPGKPTPLGPVPKVHPNRHIRSEGLFSLLGQFGEWAWLTAGEAMNAAESKKQFRNLLLDQDPYYGNFPSKFTTDEFIEKLLGMTSESTLPEPSQ